MPFSKEDLHMIKGLRESKNYSSGVAVNFYKSFQKNTGPEAVLDKLLRKISVTGSVDRVIGSGRRRSSRTEENVAASLVGSGRQTDKDRHTT